MEIREYGRNTKKKKKTGSVEEQESKSWNWITGGVLLLGLIGGGVLIYKEWDKQQKLAKLQARWQELQEQKDKVQRQYQLQELNLISAASLANSPAIRSFFTDLLRNYAEKFAERKKIDISGLPLVFEGLFLDKNTGNGYGEMGRCFKNGIIKDYSFPGQVIYPANQKEANISLNRLYLLNKLGHDKYFIGNPKYGDYTYIDISFDKMIDTCSHELAHYIQLVKHGKSSCESDLVLNNGKYDKKLAQEHQEWTEEIYQLIKAEYSEWEKRWKEIN